MPRKLAIQLVQVFAQLLLILSLLVLFFLMVILKKFKLILFHNFYKKIL